MSIYSYEVTQDDLDDVAREALAALIASDLEENRRTGEFTLSEYMRGLAHAGELVAPGTSRDRMKARVRAGDVEKRTTPQGATFYKIPAIEEVDR